MTDEAIRQEPGLAGVHDTTLAVRALISASQDLTVRMARRMDMNVSDMRAILLLSESGPTGSAELARRLGISSAATTVLVDRLERAGHLTRVRDAGDRRRVSVSVTVAAREALTHAWLPAIRELDEVCRSFPESGQAFARDLLGRLTAAMARGGDQVRTAGDGDGAGRRDWVGTCGGVGKPPTACS